MNLTAIEARQGFLHKINYCICILAPKHFSLHDLFLFLFFLFIENFSSIDEANERCSREEFQNCNYERRYAIIQMCICNDEQILFCKIQGDQTELNQDQTAIIFQKNQNCKPHYFPQNVVCSFLQEIEPKFAKLINFDNYATISKASCSLNSKMTQNINLFL